MHPMNRRDFNTSLAALLAAPAIPLPAATAASAAVPAAAPHTYLFADFIARARGRVDAGFLARQLGLSNSAARDLVQELVANNVISSPALSGVARAVNPLKYDMVGTSQTQGLAQQVRDRLKETLTSKDPDTGRADTPKAFDLDTERTGIPDPQDGTATDRD